MSSKIIINIFDEEDRLLNGLNEIISDDLCILFNDIGYYGYGLQSNYEEGNINYDTQVTLCKQIIELCKELKDVSE